MTKDPASKYILSRYGAEIELFDREVLVLNR
jgi:hypothetical protein